MKSLKVRFQKPEHWGSAIHIHFWGAEGAFSETDWPGVAMEEKSGWFAYDLKVGHSLNFVINDQQGNQTADLFTDCNLWIDSNGTQHARKPAAKKKPKGALKPSAKAKALGLPPISGKDFREETIYFLITTRFYDGDPSNNFFCRDRIQFSESGAAIDPHWRGDFKGLIQRLDYIQDLGFTAIWITPPVENRSGLDYHGYHAYDWTRVDPRLESPDATYQDLINEAHARDIKIIQDVVINHSCQFGIRDKVHIDHLPIKYYVPHGKGAGEENHGPYQGEPLAIMLSQIATTSITRWRQTGIESGTVPTRRVRSRSSIRRQVRLFQVRVMIPGDSSVSMRTSSIRTGICRRASSAEETGRALRSRQNISLETVST